MIIVIEFYDVYHIYIGRYLIKFLLKYNKRAIVFLLKK